MTRSSGRRRDPSSEDNDEKSSVEEDDPRSNKADEAEDKEDNETFHFAAFFGDKLAFEHMSSTELSTSITGATYTPHSNVQKELDGLLQSTRGGDSLDILLKLNRSMSIIAKMEEGSPEREAREVELEQSLRACGYHRKNPGELGRAIIVARYMSKRADLIEWLNEKPTANDLRPHPRILSRIKECFFLDTYLLERLFHHLCQPFAWTRREVKKLAERILENDTIDLDEWSIRDAKIYFHVLHVHDAVHLAKVVKWERVPVGADVLQLIQHWQDKIDAAMSTIRAFTLTGIKVEDEEEGLTLTFNHCKHVYRIYCDDLVSVKAANVKQWTTYIEQEEAKEPEEQEHIAETKQQKGHMTGGDNGIGTESDKLKAQLAEQVARNAQLQATNAALVTQLRARELEFEKCAAESRKALVKANTSLVLLRVFVTFKNDEWAALEAVVPGLGYGAVTGRWTDQAEFCAYIDSKINNMVIHGKDVTNARHFQQALVDKIEKYSQILQL